MNNAHIIQKSIPPQSVLKTWTPAEHSRVIQILAVTVRFRRSEEAGDRLVRFTSQEAHASTARGGQQLAVDVF